MPAWLADTKVLGALIAALVPFIGVVVSVLASVYIARRQVNTQIALKSKELDAQALLKSQELDQQAHLKTRELEQQANLKTRELEALATQLRAQQEAVRQEQLTEVLKKRIETYPALYEIIAVYGRNWEIEGKPFDHVWAAAFLKALLDNNAKNGVFFSNTVYKWYGELRTFLEQLERKLKIGRVATNDEIQGLYSIIRGPIKPSGDEREPGLGSYIKDELGSYVTLIVSATHSTLDRRNS